MKTTTSKSVLFLILTLLTLFLSSCYELSDADWELLETAFENWAEENGLLENDQWKPDGVVEKAVENTIGEMTNKDEYDEMEGLDVIRDIEEADRLASEGVNEWDYAKLSQAEMIRPRDWRIQEQKAIVKFTSGMWNTSFKSSDILIGEQIADGGNCVFLRRQQLEYREVLLADNISKCANLDSHCDDSSMIYELEKTQKELIYIKEHGNSIFCDQLK